MPSGVTRPIVPVALPVNHNVAPSEPTASPCGDGFSGAAQLAHGIFTSIVCTIVPAVSRRTISPANSSDTHSWPLASNAMPWGPLPSGISNVCIEPSRAALTMVLSFWPVIQKPDRSDRQPARASIRRGPVGHAVGRVLDRELGDRSPPPSPVPCGGLWWWGRRRRRRGGRGRRARRPGVGRRAVVARRGGQGERRARRTGRIVPSRRASCHVSATAPRGGGRPPRAAGCRRRCRGGAPMRGCQARGSRSGTSGARRVGDEPVAEQPVAVRRADGIGRRLDERERDGIGVDRRQLQPGLLGELACRRGSR